MKFFTAQRYVALQDRDAAAMDRADAAWEEAALQYDTQLNALRPQLPPQLLELLEGYPYHDAEVLSMGRQGDRFVVVLQLDVPPNDLLTITYTLAGEPQINPGALPAEYRQSRPLWLYEELEAVHDGPDASYVQSILLSNGWEVRLPFRDVQLTTARPVFPLRGLPEPGPAMVSRPA